MDEHKSIKKEFTKGLGHRPFSNMSDYANPHLVDRVMNANYRKNTKNQDKKQQVAKKMTEKNHWAEFAPPYSRAREKAKKHWAETKHT